MTAVIDSLPEISTVAPSSAADRAGLKVSDRVATVNGVSPRDIIEWFHLVDNDRVELSVVRDGERLALTVLRRGGEPFGAEVSSPLFDRVQTCDNHCEFCFIYQLPKGMRRSLYLKDDDYRLSFLYGNFTTLTRFTEADFERVVSEKLTPLYVSIHSTCPTTRSKMLRNTRGGFSLRWAQELMRHGIELRGQIVLCPGVNDGVELDRTILDLLDNYPQFSSIAIVPLGLSKHNTEERMRVHTPGEARQVVAQVERWQHVAIRILGRRLVFLADEMYLLAGIPIPPRDHYEGFTMLEDGIGLARTFLDSFATPAPEPQAFNHRLPSSISIADSSSGSRDMPNPTDYVSNPAADTSLRSAPPRAVAIRPRIDRYPTVCILTGECAEPVVAEAIALLPSEEIRVRAIKNLYFGGNTSVTGLLTGSDIRQFIAQDTEEHGSSGTLYVLPDVCLNNGVFLDGTKLEEIQRTFPLVVIPTDGQALRQFLEDFLSSRPSKVPL